MSMELNPGVLWRLGYRNMTRNEVKVALQEMYETLEYAVGNRIARALSSTQLKQFETLLDQGHEQGALAWLEKTVPTYNQTVLSEYDAMLKRLENALEASRRISRDTTVVSGHLDDESAARAEQESPDSGREDL